MAVWIFEKDWSDFVNGREIWSIKSDYTGEYDRTGMKEILVSPIEVEQETIITAKIRKKY